MNIPSIAYINANGIGKSNQTKLAAVTVWCSKTGLTQVLDSRTVFNDTNVTAVGNKYLERFANENQAN